MGGMGVLRALMSTGRIHTVPVFSVNIVYVCYDTFAISFILSARFSEACCTDAVSLGATCLINVARRRVVFAFLPSILVSSSNFLGLPSQRVWLRSGTRD